LYVYLHGMPGSSAELRLFGDVQSKAIFSLDRFHLNREGDRFEAMVQTIIARCPSSAIRLVAFSLGALPALEIASRMGTRVSGIDLIAPAAPITPQDLDMAGYPVFTIARRAPVLFRLLTIAQTALARLAPSLLYAGLFKTAQGADLALSRDPIFRKRLTDMLGQCFADGGRAYRDEISAYVAPWSQLLPKITQPVTLWHGTLDNWAPIAMSERLKMQLPNVVALNRLEGLSHYSTLQVALRTIVADDALGGAGNHA
jgi:pimeloyl-ACP methyl ester carboxylesterase